MLKDKIKDIVFSEKFEKFKKIIREKGTINGCNRCGWLNQLQDKFNFVEKFRNCNTIAQICKERLF